jgi:peptidyl-prolyl cis-trans isomerase A (cyclophilin A)
VKDFAAMKAIHLFCAFSLLAAVTAAKAEDTVTTNAAPAAPAAPAAAATATPAAPAAPVAPAYTDPSKLTETAPDTFKAEFNTTKGKIVIEVTRSLAPNGADRFYNLVKSGYFTDLAFFRVVPNFMCQFGIHGDPAVSASWREANLQDDPVKASNTRGTITFATAGPNTRTTQLFINFGDNVFLNSQGFAPFGKVVEGMDVVDKINNEYGEHPDQGRIQAQGNAYLKSVFPNLDYLKSASILAAEIAKPVESPKPEDKK